MHRGLLIALSVVATFAGAATSGERGRPGATAAAAGPGPTITAEFGAVLTLTGSSAAFGVSQEKGIRLAVQQINSGALAGVKLNAAVRDDGGDRDTGAAIYRELVAGPDVAIIGPTLANTAFVADPVAQAAGMPVLGSNGAAGITDIGNYIFLNSLTDAQMVPETVRAVVQRSNPRRPRPHP